MEDIDRKYKIKAVCVEHGHEHTEADSILFLVKDKALLPTLEFYRRKCRELGADEIQLTGIELLMLRVIQWQAEHPDKVKVADIDLPAGESVIRDNETLNTIRSDEALYEEGGI